MLVNHTYKFIFLKTRKTAGTSLEIALSRFMGGQDIVTPVSPEDERLRESLGFPGPRNFRIPWRFVGLRDIARIPGLRRLPEYYNHIPAKPLSEHLPKEIWNSYFKVSVERNPWDRTVSQYFWGTRLVKTPPAFLDYLKNMPEKFRSNWPIYAIGDRLVADLVIPFADLKGGLEQLAKAVNLPTVPEIPVTKAGSRPAKKHYTELFNDEARELVAAYCAREIKAFGYEFGK